MRAVSLVRAQPDHFAEGTPFAPDWDTAVANVAKMQNVIKKTGVAKNLIMEDNPSEPYLRFTKNAFEEKTDENPSAFTDRPFASTGD